MKKTSIIIIAISIIFNGFCNAQQEEVVDRVTAIVGDQIVMESEIRSQLAPQIRNIRSQERIKRMSCQILEQLMVQKLLLNQAKLDSVEISEAQVQAELNARLNDFVARVGSVEALEKAYSKSILEIKDDFYELVRDQLLTQQMQNLVASDVQVTPSEVEKFYHNIPPDSIPITKAQVEIRQIVLDPPYSEKAKLEVREKLLELRRRVLEGESFRILAVLYSEDEGSAANGGELGFFTKEKMYKEFSDAAFALKKNTVSRIVETEAGFHIIQLIAREGDQVNVRHILMKPKVTPAEKLQALNRLDSIANLIRKDSLSFNEAAFRFSEDENTRTTGGVVVNPNTMGTKFELNQLPPATYQKVREMEVGEISEAFEENEMATGNLQFKIVQLDNKINPHKWNLEQDYQKLQDLTIQSKQGEMFYEWIQEKQRMTYIRIIDDYRTCSFQSPGWLKTK